MTYLRISLAGVLALACVGQNGFAQDRSGKSGGSAHHAPSHHPTGGASHHHTQTYHHANIATQQKQTIAVYHQPATKFVTQTHVASNTGKIVTSQKAANLSFLPTNGGVKGASGSVNAAKANGGIGTANKSAKTFLPKGVATVHTTHGTGHTGFKTYHYNGNWYRTPWFGWGFNSWTRWCWYPRYHCYCYWSPYTDSWCYWYQPWGCYLPVECLTVMLPQPVAQPQTFIFPPAGGGPGMSGPEGVPAYPVGPGAIPGAPANPDLPPIPGGNLPVAPGPGELIPTK